MQHRIRLAYLFQKAIMYTNFCSCTYLTTFNLELPENSFWHTLYESAKDIRGVGGFVIATGFDRKAFDELLVKFNKHYIVRSGNGKSGRLRKINIGSMEYKTLCEMFCIPPSTLSNTLQQAELALDKALEELPDAQILWPTLSQQRNWGLILNGKEQLIERKWGFIDGKNFPVQEPTNTDLQNAYYNGWLHAVYVTGVLCFGVDGTIVWARHNCPGSWPVKIQ
ncbi:hypothetical protein HK096_009417, partial [Nowakowskiella sp. JEL0078]